MELFRKNVREYTARAYEVSRNLLKSRDNQRERAQRLQRDLEEQRRINLELVRQQQRLEERLEVAQRERDLAQQELQHALENPSSKLPHDPPLRNHCYGPKMISMCIQLAKKVGLRSSMQALEIVLDWLQISVKIPCWTSVRMWLCRLGIAELKQSRERHNDWIWIADHSNQIGKEKVLVILGIRACHLPPPGQTLLHDHVRVLAVVPGTQWKREDVAEQYRVLAAEIGIPRMLVTDGAVELRESVAALENEGKTPILLRDLKHFAANALERQIGDADAFKAFTRLTGLTRSSIQQTELSHFTPPSQKLKARFMNLDASLRWAEMVIWHLDHPESEARRGIAVCRMEEKLGWLRAYRDEVARWQRISAIIRETLTFINTHGLHGGVASTLKSHLDHVRQESGTQCESSNQMGHLLLGFVADSAAQLAEGERGWLSTEILESAFGAYKALEGQHNKGGFTSLLASFGALLHGCDSDRVRGSFSQTSVSDVKQWVKLNLGQTLASKKTIAYRQSVHAAYVQT